MKFSGIVGFVKTEETKPSVWEEVATPKHYYGDVTKNNRRIAAIDKIIGDVKVSNTISIVADTFMRENWGYIKYVEWNGIKWMVSDIDISYPRITLTLGEIYHGR